MKDKCSKIASLALYILFGLSAIVLILFFCVGFNEMGSVAAGFVKWPRHTDTLLVWQYILVALCLVATVAGIVISKGGKVDSQMPKIAGVLQFIGVLVLPIVLLIVGFLIGGKTPVRTGQGIYDNAFWLPATDAMLYTIYGLVIVAVIALILNMTGIFKK